MGDPAIGAPPAWLAALTAVACAAFIVGAGGPGAEAFPHKAGLLRASALVPFAGLAAFLLFRRLGTGPAAPAALRAPLALAALLGVGPALLFAAVSQVFPFYAPRGMLCFTPFLLILLASGILAMGRVGIAIVLLLAAASFGSVRTALDDPGAIDYGGVAEQWLPQVRAEDRIFIAPHWSTTPELYYLQGRYDQIVGRDWLESDAGRAWAILVPGAPRPAEMVEALESRRRVRTIRSYGLEIALFEENSR